MERGQLGAQDYRMTFPGQQQMGGQAAPQQAIDPGEYLPEQQKDPLAVRRKLTSDYYNNYALLQNIVKDAAAKGLNPFEPDYSQENGGLAFQTFQEAQAGVMYAANALAQEAQREKQVEEGRMRGDVRLRSDFDPTSELYTQTPDAYYSTQLDPRTIEANKRTAQNVYTQRDSANLNKAVYDPTKQALQSTDFGSEEGQYQQSGLLPSVPETAYQQLTQKKDDGKKYDYQIALLRKYTNLKNGVWPEGAYGKTTVNGKVYLKNEDGRGDVLGKYQSGTDKNGAPILKDKVVDSWLKDPQTGKVYIKFTDPSIPVEEVNQQSGDAVTRTFVSNNSKYGSVDKIMEAATATGLTNEMGSSVDQLLMPQDYAETQNKVRASGMQSAKVLDDKRKNLKNQLETLGDPFLGNNWIEYETPAGKTVQIGKHRGKKTFYIKNWEDLGYPSEAKNLTAEEVFGSLSDFNYFDKFLNESPQEDQTSNTPKTVNKGGKKAY